MGYPGIPIFEVSQKCLPKTKISPWGGESPPKDPFQPSKSPCSQIPKKKACCNIPQSPRHTLKCSIKLNKTMKTFRLPKSSFRTWNLRSVEPQRLESCFALAIWAAPRVISPIQQRATPRAGGQTRGSLFRKVKMD